jgi:hypothetical protein
MVADFQQVFKRLQNFLSEEKKFVCFSKKKQNRTGWAWTDFSVTRIFFENVAKILPKASNIEPNVGTHNFEINCLNLLSRLNPISTNFGVKKGVIPRNLVTLADFTGGRRCDIS